ncbi:SixA phosphatase family protein [Polaribacter tangerinus]|uniref:SixA phosphatase family protein n=1 Tax=Polaribacter tangerinus TaxID=1920034 RepID=UPI000B4B3BF0|nr:phosphoglycerate mutase family protein [Polaribacter tangerinus]
MKNYFFTLAITFLTLFSCNDDTTTTYYLIRHAEKDRTDKTNKNPNLNEQGLDRAKKWANYFKDIHLDAIYSTNYNRTQQTAQPTAANKKLIVKSYQPNNMYNDDFKKETLGKSVLIVGHSNTTPAFVNTIYKKNNSVKDTKLYKSMDDKDNASLYIVTIIGKSISSKVIAVN